MENLHIFLDNSNLWIEGQRYAANPNGSSHHLNGSYRLDFGRVIDYVSKGRVIKEARLYGSEPPPNDTVWNMAIREGFQVKVSKRNFRDQEKYVDTQMCVDVTKAVYTTDPKDRVLIILAGDSDYLPTFKEAKSKGWKIEVYFWSNANREIKRHPDVEFFDLSKDVMKLGYLDVGRKRVFPKKRRSYEK